MCAVAHHGRGAVCYPFTVNDTVTSAERPPSHSDLTAGFEGHRRLLWGLCYRMTGSAADAEDLVQETFARALERPPKGELRPWLVTVAMNLGRDLLRRRRRQAYVGPWLPEPVALGSDGLAPGDGPGASPSARYELLESASFAFLVTLEAMTPQQRAVLLLRDVFDYSVRETSSALAISEANVKTTLHRARRSMRSYDAERGGRADSERMLQIMQAFLTHVVAGDISAVEAMLARDCVALSDGGGEFFAARVPVIGRQKVAKFYAKIAHLRPAGGTFDLRLLNGSPALVATFAEAPAGQAPRVIMTLDAAPTGEITAVYSVLATPKVNALFAQFEASSGSAPRAFGASP